MKTNTLIWLLIFFFQTGFSQSWSPDFMIGFKRVSSSVISPNERKVAYEVSSPVMEGEKSEYVSQIWIASTDGSTNRQFTYGDKSCTNVQFSPDGKYLTFSSSREGNSQLYLMALDGGEPVALTHQKNGVGTYSWSPDGKNIAFLMTDMTTEQEEKDIREKRDMIVVGKYKNDHLYLLSLQKNSRAEYPVRRLTKGDFHVTDISWSPDSKTIAFTHQASPSPEGWFNADISAIPADSGEVQILVDKKGQDIQPLYSPDGKWLAFVSDGGKATWADRSDVYVMPAKGGSAKKLALTFNQEPHLIAWRADSQSLLVDETFKTNRVVYDLPIDGTSSKMITQANGQYSSPTINKAGDLMAFIFQDVSTPPEVMTLSLKNHQIQKLSSVNEDFAKMKHARTEVISWKSKDGKYTIEGMITYPKDYQKGKKYPLFLNIHGGPAGVFGQSYTGAGSIFPIQAYPDQGFVVFRPNPRGSGGYGADFRYANYGDWGVGDFDDIMAGVDYLIGENIADPDKMVVSGSSYGGYMTATTITKTTRFKAAMMSAGLTDLVSFTNTTDINGFTPDFFSGELWEKPDVYMKHSPIFSVRNVKTPTLIIHGAIDRRVPASQGQELYGALKRLGVSTEMVIYPRTQHGVEEPKFILDIGKRTLEWFHKYLVNRQ